MNRQKLHKNILLFFPIIFPLIFNFFVEDMLETAFKVSVIAELVIFTLFAVVFKRSYCSFFCMIGTMQRVVNHVGFKLFKKRFEVPAILDKYLRMMKYFLLGGLMILSLTAGKLLVETREPFRQYSMSFPTFAWIVVIIAASTIIGSLFVNNFFCKYMCVRGTIFGVAGRFSPSGIVRHADQCVNCKLCSKKCPQNLEVHKMSKVISMECLGCQNCIAVCPKKGTLTNSFASKEIPFAIFVAVALFFYILATFIVTLCL